MEEEEPGSSSELPAARNHAKHSLFEEVQPNKRTSTRSATVDQESSTTCQAMLAFGHSILLARLCCLFPRLGPSHCGSKVSVASWG